MKNNLENDLNYLKNIIRSRLSGHFNTEQKKESRMHVVEKNTSSPLQDFKKQFSLSEEEYLIFLMAFVPHIQPDFFSNCIQEFLPSGGDFVEFGGVKGINHRGVLPTGETAQFVLAGNDLQKRAEVISVFERNAAFSKHNLVWLEALREGEPVMSGRLIAAPEWVECLLTGIMPDPVFSTDFPAKLLTTKMEWSDLVLHSYTFDMLTDIRHWLEQHKKLYADIKLAPKVKPGYKTLFYGPPGTGKTLTATLLGKEFGKEVFRVDLSMVISKFIGETEKNLNKIFDKAMNKEWILFFDEADALFSKRTGVQSSHDKYANQEVSFLLQRVEDFAGLLILASNFKSNIDDAFLRRFNSIVHFPKPDAGERLSLWKNCLPDQLKLDDTVQLEQLASKYELTGGMIVNVMQYAAIRSFAMNKKHLTLDVIMDGIRKEYNKDEKSMV